MNGIDGVFCVRSYNLDDISLTNRHAVLQRSNSIFHSAIMLFFLFAIIAPLMVSNGASHTSDMLGRVHRAHPASHARLSLKAGDSGLTPQNLWDLYNLPGINGGAGQTIAEVIDGDIPTVETDLDAYSQRFGLPTCTVVSGCLTVEYQGGQRIAAGDDPTEGLLDVEIMHAVAPKAHILLYIMQPDVMHIATGPGDIMQTPGLRAINMSYGFDGDGKAFEWVYANNPHHVALFAASGDDGNGALSPPSIYPEVIAVGGTVVDGTGESAWDGSGGGLVATYTEPAYQKLYGIPDANSERGNPDVAAVAGTPIVIDDRGQWTTVTGTSEASPIWTGIAALVNKPITNDLLYSLAKSKPDSFNNISTGMNGKCGFVCTAHSGYNYITGLGTPKDFIVDVNALP